MDFETITIPFGTIQTSFGRLLAEMRSVIFFFVKFYILIQIVLEWTAASIEFNFRNSILNALKRNEI